MQCVPGAHIKGEGKARRTSSKGIGPCVCFRARESQSLSSGICLLAAREFGEYTHTQKENSCYGAVEAAFQSTFRLG